MKKKPVLFKKFHRYYWNNIELFKTFEKGLCGIKTSSNCILSNKHFENIVKIIKFFSRKQRVKIKFWFYITPNFFTTIKAKGLRMGRGKGTISHKIVFVNSGTLILNILSVGTTTGVNVLLQSCLRKLPGGCVLNFNNIW